MTNGERVGPGRRILIVEDEGIVAMHLQRELRSLGYVVLEPVASGEAALEAALEVVPDLVLMDIQLAGALDGVETARLLQAAHGVPVIYLTAFADEDRLASVEASAAYAYLVKPVDLRALRVAIETALQRHRLDAQLRASEAALRESQRTTQLALDAAELGTWRHDIADGRMHLDATARAHFGVDAEDLPIQEVMARTHPDDLPRVFESIASALDASNREGANVFECRIVRADGETRWLAVHGRTAFDEGVERRPRSTSGITRDVTARKRGEDTLRRIVSASPAMIYALAARAEGFELAWVSANVDAVTGWSEAEALAPGWWATNLHPADAERVGVQPLPRELERQALEYRFRRKDGRYVWIRDERKPSRGEGGDVDEIVGSWSDVTARVELEEQLRSAQKVEAIGRLAAGVAHDFNNLLTIIGGNCEFLRFELPEGSEGRPMLDEIRDASARAAALTRQLVAFSRSQLLAPRVVDLNEIIARVESVLRRVIGEDGCVTTSLSAALGRIRVDPVQIEQVLLNLATNARDAMPRGGCLSVETHDVELGEDFLKRHPDAKAGRHALLRVSDAGVGMTAAVRARVFEPFFTTKPQGQGTGLGLATVFGIVKQSLGHIEVESEPGEGARFDLYFPALDDAAERDAQRSPSSAPRRGSETILLAEDEAGVRRLACAALERHGYRVLLAEHGRTALELAEAHVGPLDLLVTDVIMPELDGGRLARAIRALRPTIKVLFISGYVADAIELRGVEGASVELLAKPFTALELARKVRRVLDGR